MLKEEQKTANAVTTVFEQKFAFENFRLHFWEKKNELQQEDAKKKFPTPSSKKISTQIAPPLP